MNERFAEYLRALRAQLNGLPEPEIEDAVRYYEEYLADAAEAGSEPDAVLAGLDSPKQAAAQIRAEFSIARARSNPSIRSFSGVLSSMLRTVTTPFAVLLMLLCFVPSILLVGAFSLAFIVFLVSALIAASALIYEAGTAVLFQFSAFLGAVGLALFIASLLLFLALMFFRLARLMIRLSALIARGITKRPGQTRPDPEADFSPQPKKSGKALIVLCTVFASVGLILFSVSGLALKYFTLFNSMESSYSEVKTASYSPSEIHRIELMTTHTNIRVLSGKSDKITLTYEQVDWLQGEPLLDGSKLAFVEFSNQTLPLFQLAQLHHNSAELTITLPQGYAPEAFRIETCGGFVYLTDPAFVTNDNLPALTEIKTTSGYAYLPAEASLDITTGTGRIESDGQPVGKSTQRGNEYTSQSGTGRVIRVESTSGSVYISRISQ